MSKKGSWQTFWAWLRWFIYDLPFGALILIGIYILYRVCVVKRDNSGPFPRIKLKPAAMRRGYYVFRPKRVLMEREKVAEAKAGEICAFFQDNESCWVISSQKRVSTIWLTAMIARCDDGFSLHRRVFTWWGSSTGSNLVHDSQHPNYEEALSELLKWLTSGVVEDAAELDVYPMRFPYLPTYKKRDLNFWLGRKT